MHASGGAGRTGALLLSPEAVGKRGSVRGGREPLFMGARFIGVGREQVFLMPPSVRDWVPDGHLVWTVLDAVGELDLSAFYAAYRADGHGRPAYEPAMVVALLMSRTRAGTARRAGSSGRAWRTSPIASWPATWCPITRRSRTSAAATTRAGRGVLGRAGALRAG